MNKLQTLINDMSQDFAWRRLSQAEMGKYSMYLDGISKDIIGHGPDNKLYAFDGQDEETGGYYWDVLNLANPAHLLALFATIRLGKMNFLEMDVPRTENDESE